MHQAQLAVANDYGFKSWRALKAHIDSDQSAPRDRNRVFEAARAGDVETVRRAFASGFDPATPDPDGRTIHQIAKERRHRGHRVACPRGPRRNIRSGAELEAVQGIMPARRSRGTSTRCGSASTHTRTSSMRWPVAAFQKATALHLAALRNQHAAARLLIERGADLDAREFPDNAAPLHFAAMYGDLDLVRLLVEAGADVEGKGDDHEVGMSVGRPASGRCERTWRSTCSTTGQRSTCGGDRAR